MKLAVLLAPFDTFFQLSVLHVKPVKHVYKWVTSMKLSPADNSSQLPVLHVQTYSIGFNSNFFLRNVNWHKS